MSEDGDFWREYKEAGKERKANVAVQNEALLAGLTIKLGLASVKVTNATWRVSKGSKMLIYYSSTGKAKINGNGKMFMLSDLDTFITNYFK